MILGRPSLAWAREFVVGPFVGDGYTLPQQGGNVFLKSRTERKKSTDAAADLAMVANPIAFQSASAARIRVSAKRPRRHVPDAFVGQSMEVTNVDFTMIPAWSNEGVTVGSSLHRVNQAFCPLTGEFQGQAFCVGRFVRDERTGETLILANDRDIEKPTPSNERDSQVPPVHVVYMRHDSTIECSHFYALCDGKIFGRGQFVDSVLMAEIVTQKRDYCPVCSAPADACCSCALPLTIPVSSLDFKTFEKNSLLGNGAWSGDTRYAVRDRFSNRLGRMRFHGVGVCEPDQDTQIARLLQSMAIQCALNESKVPNELAIVPKAPANSLMPPDDCYGANNNNNTEGVFTATPLLMHDTEPPGTDSGLSDTVSSGTSNEGPQPNGPVLSMACVDASEGCLPVPFGSLAQAEQDTGAGAALGRDSSIDLAFLSAQTSLGANLSAAGVETHAEQAPQVGNPISIFPDFDMPDLPPSSEPLTASSSPNPGAASGQSSLFPVSSMGVDSAVMPRCDDSIAPSIRGATLNIAPRTQGAGDESPSRDTPCASDQRDEALDPQEIKRRERQEKNRAAAARSNAKRREYLQGLKANIEQGRASLKTLEARERALREENRDLKERAATLWKEQARAMTSPPPVRE